MFTSERMSATAARRALCVATEYPKDEMALEIPAKECGPHHRVTPRVERAEEMGMLGQRATESQDGSLTKANDRSRVSEVGR